MSLPSLEGILKCTRVCRSPSQPESHKGSIWDYFDGLLSIIVLGDSLLLRYCCVGGGWFVVFSLTFINGENAYLVRAVFHLALCFFELMPHGKSFFVFFFFLYSATIKIFNSDFLESFVNASSSPCHCTQG